MIPFAVTTIAGRLRVVTHVSGLAGAIAGESQG